MDKIKILHLEDIVTDAEHIHRVLNKAMLDCEVMVVDTKTEFTRMLNVFNPDLVISDHSLPNFSSLEALEIIKRTGLKIPFILVTGAVSEEFAAQVIKNGADDYILKDHPQRLPKAVINALEKSRLDKQVQALIQERAHLASIVNFSDDAIISKTLDGTITSWNKSAERIFGYRAAEIIGKNVSILYSPDQQKEEGKILEKLEHPEFVEYYETTRVTKSGHIIEISLTTSPLKDAAGNIIGVSNISRDISERKKTEREIRESRNHYAELLQKLPAAVYTCDHEGKIILFNKAAEELWGRTPDTEKDKWCGSLRMYNSEGKAVPPDNSAMAIAITTGTVPTHEEFRIERPDGSIRYVIPYPVYTLDLNGKLTGAVNVLIDITQLKEAARVVMSTKENLQQILDLSLDAICTVNNRNEFVTMSAACFEIWGYRPEELIGRCFTDFVIEEDINHSLVIVADVMKGQPITNFENRYKRKNGTIVPVIWAARWDAKTNLIYCIARNGTQKNEAEEKIIASEKRSRALIENSADMQTLALPDGTLIYASPSVTKILGYTGEEYIRQTTESTIHPDDIPGIVKKIIQVLKTPGSSFFNQHRLRHKEGHWVWTEGNTTNLLHEPSIGALVSNFRDITERRMAEEKIKQSETNLRQIVDLVPHLIFVKDDAGKFILVNKRFAEMYGISATEILEGKNVSQNAPVFSEAEHFIREDLEVIKAGVKKIMPDSPFTDFKGNKYVFHTIKVPYISAATGQKAVLEIAMDVTESRKVAAELFNEREKLKAIIENMNAGLVVADAQGRFVFRNDLARDLFGLEKEQREMDSWAQKFGVFRPDKVTVFPLDELPMAKAIKGIKTDKEILYVKNEFRPEGTFLSVSGAPICNSEGKPMYGVTVFRDVTETIDAEEKLKESFEALQAASEMQTSILDALPANIALLDKDGFIVEVNQAWKNFGVDNSLCNSDFNINDNYIEIAASARGIDREEGQLMAEGIKKVLNGEIKGYHLEYACHSPVEQRWFNAEVAPLMKEHGKGAVVMHINITARKMAEVALQELNDRLEEKVNERTALLEGVNLELEAFSYSVSHDLRAPLRAVNGYSKILEEDYTAILDEEGHRLLRIIQSSAERMNTLIEDLLAFSKLGRQALRQSVLDMNMLMQDTVTDLSQFTNFKAEIKINELHPVLGDLALMKHVVMNLLANAIKYSSLTEKPRIEISSRATKTEIIYSIKDNGVGFDMQYAGKLFGVFQRLHSNDQFEGTGVGLAIVQRIIHRHKGKVWAEGLVGKGATFYFSLPKENADLFSEN